MANDIVKQIILKFKSEGSDQVKRVAEALNKTFSPRETERFLKSLENLQQKFGAPGKGLSAEFKKISEYFKELNERQFIRAERNLERFGRLMVKQIENIERLKREGASTEVISKAEATLSKTRQKIEGLEGMFSAGRGRVGRFLEKIGLTPERMGTFSGYAAATSGITTTIAAGAGLYNEYQAQSIRNRIEVANFIKSQMLDVFSGDMSKAVLYGDPRRRQQIQSDIKHLTYSKNIEEGAKTIAGLAGGIAALLKAGAIGAGAGAAAGTFLGPVGTALGGIAGFAVGAGGAFAAARSAKSGFQYFVGGGMESYKAQAVRLAEERARASTLDVELYKKFAERAPLRYEYQRLLQLGSDKAIEVRDIFRNANIIDESQMINLMMGFRGLGGTRQFAKIGPNLSIDFMGSRAAYLGTQTAALARRYDLSTEALQQNIAQAVRYSRTNAEKVPDELKEVIEEGFKRGLAETDIETLLSIIADTLKQTNNRLTVKEAAAESFKFLTGETGFKEIEAIGSAKTALGRVFQGTSPLGQTLLRSEILGALFKNVKKGDALAIARAGLGAETIMSIINSNPDAAYTLHENPIVKDIFKKAGYSEEDIKKFFSDYYRKRILTPIMSHGLIGQEKTAKDLLKEIAKDKIIDIGETATLSEVLMKGMGSEKPEVQRAFLTKIFNLLKENDINDLDLTGLKFETEKGKTDIQNIIDEAKAKGAPIALKEGVQVSAQAAGEALLEKNIKERIFPNLEKFAESFKKNLEEAAKMLEDDTLSKSISGITDAAEKLRKALDTAADIINSSKAFNSATRANSRAIGEEGP